jgi:hypothetical protein
LKVDIYTKYTSRRLWDLWQQYMNKEDCETIRKSGKIVPLDGDITLPHLGLDSTSLPKLQQEVTLVIHAASMMHLKKPLSEIAPSVIYATDTVAEFALKCQNLVRFVYISSAYASAFIRRALDGTISGFDETIKEQINDIRNGPLCTNAELMDLREFGTTPEYTFVRHLHPYTYAKHLTERLLIQKFSEYSVPERLLICRPSAIGPAEEFPKPYFEVPGSSPITTFAAAVLISPPIWQHFSSYLTNPSKATYDEIPVDIVVNRLIAHTAYGTTGCVHAVPGIRGRQLTEQRWIQITQLRPFWLGRPILTWCKADWGSEKLCTLSRLFLVCGNAFEFEDNKTEALWEKLSDEEQEKWPLWAESSISDSAYISGRKQAIQILTSQMMSRKFGLPISWSARICNWLFDWK